MWIRIEELEIYRYSRINEQLCPLPNGQILYKIIGSIRLRLIAKSRFARLAVTFENPYLPLLNIQNCSICHILVNIYKSSAFGFSTQSRSEPSLSVQIINLYKTGSKLPQNLLTCLVYFSSAESSLFVIEYPLPWAFRQKRN